MSPDFRRFLVVLAASLLAGWLTYRYLTDGDSNAAFGTACMVTALGPIVLLALSRPGDPPARASGPRGAPIPVPREQRPDYQRERLLCTHCQATFWNHEVGWGYAGSRDDYCETCPRCGYWVRDHQPFRYR